MTSKFIAWILGIILVVVLGALIWLWQSRERTVLAPAETPNQIQNTKQGTSAVETPVAGTETSSANLDDITNNIGSDANDDLSAIDNEATAELNSVEEGGNAVNDLGKTYDESQY
jgi:cytoskeletal protein RodZ